MFIHSQESREAERVTRGVLEKLPFYKPMHPVRVSQINGVLQIGYLSADEQLSRRFGDGTRFDLELFSNGNGRECSVGYLRVATEHSKDEDVRKLLLAIHGIAERYRCERVIQEIQRHLRVDGRIVKLGDYLRRIGYEQARDKHGRLMPGQVQFPLKKPKQ